MRKLAAPLSLVARRARRTPRHWLAPALGIAVAAGFAGGVAAEGTITGDQAARAVLSGLPPSERVVRVTWSGVVTASVSRQANALLRALGGGAQTQVVLLNPVRLSGVVVRPVAISPLARWISPGRAALGDCRPNACRMLLVGGRVAHNELSTAGARIAIVGAAQLTSAVPLGYTPGSPSDQLPLLVSGDVTGLDSLASLGGMYRSRSWLAPLPVSGLHSWQLPPLLQRLQQAQAALLSSASGFSLAAPFDGLAAARAQAAEGPRQLLLAGGGALAALAVFVVLAAGGLRRDVENELTRLQNAGARFIQQLVFVAGEAAWLSATALSIGAALAVGTAALLSTAQGSPIGGVLTHSMITPTGLAALAAGWLCAWAVITLSLLIRGRHVADLLAVAAVAALAVAVPLGAQTGAGNSNAILLAPLCCLAAGVAIFRLAAPVLRAGERLARRGPTSARLAFVGLARAPSAPSLAIAFIAVSTSLGGFALAYRATLLRSASDQAADRVPLDATISAGTDFASPLSLAPIQNWQAIAGGAVQPVRRTDASYLDGGATVTVPALGVPAAALKLLHGWRKSDGSAPLQTLALRLTLPGPSRIPGPQLPAETRALSLQLSAAAVAVSVSADLRSPAGSVQSVALGEADRGPRTVRAPLPLGRWELQALTLSEPVGLEVTNGHQNGESPTPTTRFATTVGLGSLFALGGNGVRIAAIALGGWRGSGAASGTRSSSGRTIVRFATNGTPGVLRPAQPSDLRPVPVLVDPQTAAAAGRRGQLALTIDGLPVRTQVVGVLSRFPTLAPDASGFVIADESTLASALEAQAPGQGRADELWISSSNLAVLRAALRHGALTQLSAAFRSDLQRRLRAAPIARGVLGTLVAAAALSALLAALGLVVALVGAGRDGRVECDLVEQGMGPRAMRVELRLRMLVTAGVGVCIGLGIAVLLTQMAVAAVRSAGSATVPTPPLVTVSPWGELALWGVCSFSGLATACWLITRGHFDRAPCA